MARNFIGRVKGSKTKQDRPEAIKVRWSLKERRYTWVLSSPVRSHGDQKSISLQLKLEIIQQFEGGKICQAALGREYNFLRSTIKNIMDNKREIIHAFASGKVSIEFLLATDLINNEYI